MKILTIVYCLFLSINVFGQEALPLYIVDGKEMSSIKDIPSKDILQTAILGDTVAEAKYGPKAINGAMVVTTVKGAIGIYEVKFAPFSKKYKNYIEKKHGDDSNLSYVIGNTMMKNGTKKTVGELYDIKPGDIKSIDYKTDSRFKTDATIIITVYNQDN
jgi:hypothetical protein